MPTIKTGQSKNFNAKAIQKYFKDIKPPIKPSEKFTDPLFPPTLESIVGCDGKQIDGANGQDDIPIDDIEWVRIDDIAPGFEIFVDGIDMEDIYQKNLGHCYFVSAISSVAKNPHLISRLFRSKKKNNFGYFEVVLFIDGEWQVVVIDDYFLVYKNRDQNNIEASFVCSNPKGKELWTLILEKAWAKVNGSYKNIDGGFEREAFLALTGINSEVIKYNLKEGNLNLDVFEKILVADRQNTILSCSTQCVEEDDEEKANFYEENGIVSGHAFTLVSANEGTFGDEKVRLLKIRNPWGSFEWKGDYSDFDKTNWTDEKKRYFGYSSSDNDDGVFYMKWEDHLKFFEDFSIVKILNDPFSCTWKVSNDEIRYPQVFNFCLEQKSYVEIAAMFRYYRYNREDGFTINNTSNPTSIILAKCDKNGKFKKIQGKFNDVENCFIGKRLEKGKYVVWIYWNVDISIAPVQDRLLIRFLCDRDFSVQKTKCDKNFDLLKAIIYSHTRRQFKKISSEPDEELRIHQEINLFKSGIDVLHFKSFNANVEDNIRVSIDCNESTNSECLYPFSSDKKGAFVFKNEALLIMMRRNVYGYEPNLEYDYESKVLDSDEDIDCEIYKNNNNISHFLAFDKLIDSDPNKQQDLSNQHDLPMEKLQINDNDDDQEEEVLMRNPKYEKMLVPIFEQFPDAAKDEIVTENKTYKLVHLKTQKCLYSNSEELDEKNNQQISCCNDENDENNLFTFEICFDESEGQYVEEDEGDEDEDEEEEDEGEEEDEEDEEDINKKNKEDEEFLNEDFVKIIHDKSGSVLFMNKKNTSVISGQKYVCAKNSDDNSIEPVSVEFMIEKVYSPYSDDLIRTGTIIRLLNRNNALTSRGDYLDEEEQHQEVSGFDGLSKYDYWTII